MNIRWNDTGRTNNRRAQAHLRARTARLPLRRRIDVILITLLLICGTLLSLVWSAGIFALAQNGVLDPSPLQRIEDERLGTNVRDHLADQPLLDATFHAPNRRVYITQAGGTIHSYDPATHLWSTERPLPPASAISSDLVLLRSGCGRDIQSDRTDACADPTTIWALSRQGGLVRRNQGQWEVLVGDLAWVGKRGRPVEGDSLTAGALSADGRWLLIGTREDGVGLYDNQRRAWAALPQIVQDAANPAATSAIVWWQDAFWIGGPQGLIALTPSEQQPQFQPVPGRVGQILDLDSADDGLWVLEQHACAGQGSGCRWLGKLHGIDGAADTLVDEQSVYADLNLTDLIFAQQWAQQLVVAGAHGIFSYDPQRHSWKQLFDKPVHATLPLPGGDGFYFAFPGGAARIQGDQIRTWPVADDQVERLLFGRDADEVLGLTRAGNLLSFGDAEQPTALFQAGRTSFDPEQFTSAVDLGGAVFFLGPEGVLLHTLDSRRYTDIPLSTLPMWMRQPNIQIHRADDYVYFLIPEGTDLSIYPVSVQDLIDSSTYAAGLRAIKPQTIRGPVQRIWSWPGFGIGVIDGEGSVQSVSPTGVARQIGQPLTALDGATLLDVAQQAQTLLLATNAGVRWYDADTRAWVQGPRPNQPIVEVNFYQGQALGRTDQGELLTIADPSATLIGTQAPSQIGDQSLSDARQVGDDIYMAGAGRIERYSQTERRIAQHWSLPATDAVRLKGVIGANPLALSGGRATLGEQAIDQPAGTVADVMATAGTIWTIRSAESHQYLKGYPAGNPFNNQGARCFFRTPVTPRPVSRVDDARALPNGAIAVATDAGLMFYVPQARSWYAGATSVGANGGRLYLLDQHLAITEQLSQTARIGLIALDSIALPNSCSADPVKLTETIIDARATAVDESGARFAWIRPNGATAEWHAGTTQELLATSEGGPDTSQFRRAYSRNGYLLFTTADSIWRYEQTLHQWTRIELRFPSDPEPLEDINIEVGSAGETVTAHAASGNWLVGQFAPADERVTMELLIGTPQPSFGTTADHLTDIIGAQGTSWTFVLDDRLKYFDPSKRAWVGEALFDTIDQGRTLQRVLDRYVALGNAGQSWWVAGATGAQPAAFARYDLQKGEQTALDSTGKIWRLTGNGELISCAQTDKIYACAPTGTPPMLLATASVRHAYSWDGLTIFDTTAGLRAFEPRAGVEVRVDSVPTLSSITTARAFERRLLLHDGNTLVALSRATDGTINALRWAGVSALIFDGSAIPWARFGSEWRRWSGGDWVAPTLGDGRTAAQAGIEIFANEGMVAGLGRDGRLYRWGSALISDTLALPQTITPAQVDLLIPAQPGEWWVRVGKRLTHLVPSSCAAPTSIPAPSVIPTATHIITATSVTPAVTATPTPSPAPTPTPTPCLAQQGVDLPALFAAPERPASAKIATDGLTLIRADGSQVKITIGSGGGAYTLTPSQSSAPTLAGASGDDWPTKKGFQHTLANGSSAFDPVINLAVDPQGHLMAVRPSVQTQIATSGALKLERPQALDTGWLKWDRAGSQFVVAGPAQSINLRKDQFVIDGQLLFEPVAAVLAETPDHFHIANQHGIWSYSQPVARLDDPAIRFQPVALSTPITPAHSRFLTSRGDIAPGSAAIKTANLAESVQIGDTTISEQVRVRAVSATLQRGGAVVPALASDGFLWDQGRRGIGYGEGKLYIQTSAGIHPVAGFGPFDAGPPNLGDGQLRSDPAAGLLINTDTGWYHRDRGRWQTLQNDPARNRLLVRSPAWEWVMRDGRFTITLSGPAFGFSYGTLAGGYGFRNDQMTGAATLGDKLFVMNEAFLEIADQPDALATLSAARLDAIPTERLEAWQAANGQPALFHYQAGSVRRWDASAQRFLPVASGGEPDISWRLVETSRLRLTHRDKQPVAKEIRLDIPAGGDRWVPFDMIDGRFPFDIVTAFEADGSQLYVGTAAGLEVYTRADFGLDQIDRLYDLSATAGALARVQRLGRPPAAPTHVLASADLCIEMVAGAPPQSCADPALIATRLRARSDLWEWTADAGVLAGRYLARDGSTLPVVIKGGLFAHDRIRDVAVCAGKAYTIWENGWVTTYPGARLALQPGLANDTLAATAASRFICLSRDTRMGQVSATAGEYIEGSQGAIVQLTATGWQPVANPDIIAGLQTRADRPPIVDRVSVRLLPRTAEAGLTFEQQSRDGGWHALAWADNRVAIDEWHEVLAIDQHIWAATPLGLVQFNRDAAGMIRLDPDTLVLVRDPADAQGICQVTDLRRGQDGVLARCDADSAQVYQGQLDGTRDSGVFLLYPQGDPFSEQTLIDAKTGHYWEWMLKGRTGGSPGLVTARRLYAGSTEDIQLLTGRFGFDTLNSLALYTPDVVEIGTDAGGWYESPRDTFDLAAWKRPQRTAPDPKTVTHVGITRVGAQRLLCLALSGSTVRIAASGSAEPVACEEDLGADDLWQYQHSAATGRLMAVAKTGAGVRQIVAGRFTDDLISSLPVVGMQGDVPYYLLPTAAGVIRMVPTRERISITTDFVGLPEGQVPAALYMWDADTPAYLAGSTLYRLDDNERLADIALDLPEGATVLKIEDGLHDILRVEWMQADRRGWSLFVRKSGQAATRNRLILDLSTHTRFQRRGASSPAAEVGVAANGLDLYWPHVDQPYHESYPAPIDMLTAVVYDDRVLLIGKRELYEFNIEAALLQAYRTQSSG
jgi:hypothetical protein